MADAARDPGAPPLRILIVVTAFPKISETFVLDHALGLAALGHDVTVLSRGPAPEPLRHARYDAGRARFNEIEYERSGRVARRLALARGLVACLSRRPLATLRFLRDRPLPGGREVLLAAAAVAAQPRYDVVHAHFGPVGLLVARLRDLGVLTSARTFTSFHGYDVGAFAQTHGSLAYRPLWQSEMVAVANGSDIGRRLVDLGAAPERVAVVPIGVAAAPAHVARPQADVATAPRLLSIGRFVEKKGHAFGLHAFARVAERHPDARYALIGGGPLEAPLRALAAELGIAERVEFHGASDDATVAALLAHADLLVTPSVTATDGDREGMVVANMEAMARGLAVVATRHAAIPELVLEGETGLLCDERDVAGLAAAIERLVADSALRATLGAAGRERVARHFSLAEHVRRLVLLYRA